MNYFVEVAKLYNECKIIRVQRTIAIKEVNHACYYQRH